MPIILHGFLFCRINNKIWISVVSSSKDWLILLTALYLFSVSFGTFEGVHGNGVCNPSILWFVNNCFESILHQNPLHIPIIVNYSSVRIRKRDKKILGWEWAVIFHLYVKRASFTGWNLLPEWRSSPVEPLKRGISSRHEERHVHVIHSSWSRQKSWCSFLYCLILPNLTQKFNFDFDRRKKNHLHSCLKIL